MKAVYTHMQPEACSMLHVHVDVEVNVCGMSLTDEMPRAKEAGGRREHSQQHKAKVGGKRTKMDGPVLLFTN